MNIAELRKRLARNKHRMEMEEARVAVRAARAKEHDSELHPEMAEIINVIGIAFAVADALQQIKPFTRFWSISEEAGDRHMPSYPPMSPVTDSLHATWSCYDVKLGGFGSLADILWSLSGLLRLTDAERDAIDRARQSHLAWYEIVSVERKQHIVRLRDLITETEIAVYDRPRITAATPGTLWLARCVRGPGELWHCVTTPYVASPGSKAAWLAYFARQGVKDANSYERHMRFGNKPDYWLEYAMDAYVGHNDLHIFVRGVPDRPRTLPHSLENDGLPLESMEEVLPPQDARTRILQRLLRTDAFARALEEAQRLVRQHLADALREPDFDLEQVLGDDTLPRLLGPAALHAPLLAGYSVAERGFEERDAASLTAEDEAGWRELLSTRYVIAEVLDTEPGVRLRVKDLIRNRTFWIYDTRVSRSMQRFSYLSAWIFKRGRSFELESDAYELSASRATEMARHVRELVRTQSTSREHDEAHIKTLSLAVTAMVAIQQLVQSAPVMQTTTGEALQPCVGHFTVHDRDVVIRAIDELADWHRSEDDGEPPEWTWVLEREPSAPMRTTSLASAVLEGKALRVQCLARERLERAKEILRRACGPALTHRADALEALPDWGPGSKPDAAPVEPPPEAQELIAQHYREHLKRWPDEPVPALSNLSPRLAVELGMKKQVIDLLKGQEAIILRQLGPGRVDFGWLYAELNLKEPVYR